MMCVCFLQRLLASDDVKSKAIIQEISFLVFFQIMMPGSGLATKTA